MEKLRNWIKQKGTVKQFLDGVGISRSYFSEWESGKKRISLQIASRIVEHTQGAITYGDLARYEKKFLHQSDLVS